MSQQVLVPSQEQLVSLQLTPMQLPEANPLPPASALAMLSPLQTGDRTCRLRLAPGERSEITLQIRNLSDRLLYLDVEVLGNYPNHWCRVIWRDPAVARAMDAFWLKWYIAIQSRAAELADPDLDDPELNRRLEPWAGGLLYDRLAPRLLFEQQQRDTLITFSLEADFLEGNLALGPGDRRLLDYVGQINVYAYHPAIDPDARTAAIEASEAADPGDFSQNGSRPSALLPQQIGSADFSVHVRPRGRYHNYLPAVYREIDLMGRFLSLFEEAFDPAVQTLRLFWAYLDPLTTSEALLPFLAHWVGWPSDIPRSLSQQRRLVRHAMSIYRWRGTRWGLLLYLHFFTGLPISPSEIPPEERYLETDLVLEPADYPPHLRHIQIETDSSEGFVVGTTCLGPDAILDGARPFHFTVRLRSPTPLDEALIRRIINREKPAFCSYELLITYVERISANVQLSS